MKKISQIPGFLFFMFFVVLIGLLPFRIMYMFSDFVAFMLRKVFKYRLKLVKTNLRRTNLSLTPKEESLLIRKIYRNLSDIILEGIKSFSMSQQSIKKRHKVLNPEIIEPYINKGISTILVTGHIGNWEWGSLSAGIQTDYQIIGFYKPLKNKLIDNFLKRSRSKFGTILSPIRFTKQAFETHKSKPCMFLMAADQNPRIVGASYWIDFLGRKTAFLHGPEKYFKIYNYPIVYADIIRVKRGYYELYLTMLIDQASDRMEDGGITRLYVDKLEASIRTRPHSWLWTHRRWKHTPPQQQ